MSGRIVSDMEPKRNEVGVIFTQYDEIAALEDALPYLRAYIHFELANAVIDLMPPVESIMDTHRKMLPLIRQSGAEIPNPSLHFNMLQAGIASAVFAIAALQSEQQLPRAQILEENDTDLLEAHDETEQPPPIGYEEMVYKIDAAIDMSIDLQPMQEDDNGGEVND